MSIGSNSILTKRSMLDSYSRPVKTTIQVGWVGSWLENVILMKTQSSNLTWTLDYKWGFVNSMSIFSTNNHSQWQSKYKKTINSVKAKHRSLKHYGNWIRDRFTQISYRESYQI